MNRRGFNINNIGGVYNGPPSDVSFLMPPTSFINIGIMGCNSSSPIDLDPLIMKSECDHDDFSEEIVVLPNGSKRNLLRWIPKSNTIKAVVLVAHGVHEHALICDRVCHAFTSKDVACFGEKMIAWVFSR